MVFNNGKRRSRQQPSSSSQLPVIIRKSGYKAAKRDPYELSSAVVNYVNAMLSEGLFIHDEIPPCTIQIYYADYYVGQVNNGGHSQFIGNSGEAFDSVARNAFEGLRAMGASEHARLLEQAIKWVADNPSEAKAQTGFEGGRADALEELDDKFYGLENETSFYDCSARWIKAWPNLKIVADRKFDAEMNALFRRNTNRKERAIGFRILGIHRQITDPLNVGLGIAATSCQPAEYVERVMGAWGGNVMRFEGEEQMMWDVQTTNGTRFGVVAERSCALYEQIQQSAAPDANNIENFDWSKYEEPKAGERLSKVASVDAEYAINQAQRTKVAAAIDLLLEQKHIGAENVSVSNIVVTAEEKKRSLSKWAILTKDKGIYCVSIDDNGARIVTLGGVGSGATSSAAISTSDIEKRWAYAQRMMDSGSV